jgi:hypothetical protein
MQSTSTDRGAVHLDDAADDVAVGGLVDWGDGSADSTLVADGPGSPLRATHTYRYGGWYPVMVTLQDRWGGWSTWHQAGAVEIDGPSRPPENDGEQPCQGVDCGWPFPNDSVAPVVKVTRPAKAERQRAKAWRTIKGTVSDRGSGAVAVTVAVVVRTSAGWAYRDGTTWRTASTRARAMRRTGRVFDRTVTTGRWRVRLRTAPPRGVIHAKVWAVDLAANRSAPVRLRQRLTR